MALSKPQLGIQSPILCQLCEREPKISWKCLECDLLMCNACKNNIHPKIKTAGEHMILDFKDIGKISSPSKNIGSTSPSSKDPANIDITLVEEYKTNLDGIFHLAISLDGSLWIGNGDHKKGIRLFSSHTGLQKVKCEGNKLKVTSSFNSYISGIAITPGNDLLIATRGSILKQIKSGTNKIIDTVFDLGSGLPSSIHVTRKNKVIVGTYVTEEKSTVVVMNHEGNCENVYGEDQTKGVSFSSTTNITSTSNDHIFVVEELIGNTEGRVFVLGQGNLITIYSGHSVINTVDIPFKPCDLTTTPADNVIVVDFNSNTLHILNSSGQLMTYISTGDKGILTPISIGLAMAGNVCMLYIGCPESESKDAKLYKLNMIGC
ncbi:Hypothetical predicted protein [Mytilus galloprovincialis]|uniref:B box-type domain-containing protein n=1 Tax=Mytilus galloprovincialis TaxID=29158 RepID=A0A8B6GFE0_MYTGA|nr:Hypothetical predicted protein [Mytilus galloprovincialis]